MRCRHWQRLRLEGVGESAASELRGEECRNAMQRTVGEQATDGDDLDSEEQGTHASAAGSPLYHRPDLQYAAGRLM